MRTLVVEDGAISRFDIWMNIAKCIRTKRRKQNNNKEKERENKKGALQRHDEEDAGRKDGRVPKLKREKAQEIQRTREEKKKDEWTEKRGMR